MVLVLLIAPEVGLEKATLRGTSREVAGVVDRRPPSGKGTGRGSCSKRSPRRKVHLRRRRGADGLERRRDWTLIRLRLVG